MKLFKKFLFLLILLIIVSLSLACIIGFSYYSKALKEKPLLDRVTSVTSKEHYTSFNNLPKNYIDAVIATEDKRFYKHGAVDFIAISRAIISNISSANFDEGGSTITQQVAKNIIFSQEKTLERKLGEVFAAFDLEKNYSKDEIFALYVNSSYFGDGYNGIYEASIGYYNKEPKNLNLDEASMLAGIPNAPSIYSPTVNPNLAKERQLIILDNMLNERYISQEDFNLVTN